MVNIFSQEAIEAFPLDLIVTDTDLAEVSVEVQDYDSVLVLASFIAYSGVTQCQL